MADLYRVSAKYYDEAYATLEDLRDLQFYLGMARRTGGSPKQPGLVGSFADWYCETP
jgi:hypothetical protein